VVYDQSGRGNNMWYQGSAAVPGSPQSSPARATSESLTIGGGKAYSLYINPGNSYWRDGHLTGVPTGTAPEGMYMVTSGTHVNSGCCFDYGNSETTRSADAAGAMDAINFGTQCWFGGCSGSGPWVQADLEWGLYSGGSQSWNPNQRAFPSKFVTAVLKNNGTTTYAIKDGNAQSGGLATRYNGSLPTQSGYKPMTKQGAIILGIGGDNSNGSVGSFFEGVMTSGYPTDATENSVQANIVSVGYGKSVTFPVSGTAYRLTNLASGKVLDATNCGTGNGTTVQQWDNLSNACQQWRFTNVGANKWTITNVNAGLCLDAYGAATANGTQLVLWACGTGDNQKWTLS
jgi:hypothetical protein